MTSTAQLVILFIAYYVLLGIGMSALVFGGVIDQEVVDTNIVYAGSEYRYNDTITSDEVTVGNTFQTVLSFGINRLDLGLPAFVNWIIAIIFVWTPTVIGVLLLLYSLKSGSS